jgi:putative glutamate/gamma-aminobutyrate antiporter
LELTNPTGIILLMTNATNKNKGRILGVFSLTMINVAAIISLRNFPLMAHVGWESVFYYVLAGLGFFVPAALVSAELATGWPSRGGVYTWVKEAFGARWGFVAIWMQWISNVVWYPTVLSFTAATIAYIIDPALGENKVYILSIVLGVYWASTIIDLLGMKASSIFSTIGVIFGVMIPCAIIIASSLHWLILGNPSHIPFSWSALIPKMEGLNSIVFLVGVFLGMCGIEMSAVHAREVDKPQQNYPKAIFFSTIMILSLSLLGSLAISIVVPPKNINIISGTMQAFSAFFTGYGMEWMIPVMAGLMTIGPVAAVSTWIVGPSKGLYQTSEEGHLPPFMHWHNQKGMPVMIMMIQGTLVTLLCLAFILIPTVSGTYWFLNALATLLYLIMYILMFGAAIYLRYKHPEAPRNYRIPGGKVFGMWVVAGIGLAASLFAFSIGFVPPEQVDTGSFLIYEVSLCLALVVMFLAPIIIFACRKDHWKRIVQRDI